MYMPDEKDLFILTADSQLERTLRTLLDFRRPSLGIRDISFEIRRHQNKDPGCRTESVSYLRELQGEYAKAMVVFDFRGCGAENVEPEGLEEELEDELSRAGWSGDAAAVIVIYPELEAWLFGGSFQRLQETIDWTDHLSISAWFVARGFLEHGNAKPTVPQAAMDSLLSQANTPRSSRLFEQIAKRQSLARCQDRAYQKFCHTLQGWFPPH